LKQYDEAADAFELGLEVAPEDAGLKSGLAEVMKARAASEKASGGGLGGLFGPQMLTKLVGHPKFGMYILYVYMHICVCLGIYCTILET
jgi:hypothetical protein